LPCNLYLKDKKDSELVGKETIKSLRDLFKSLIKEERYYEKTI